MDFRDMIRSKVGGGAVNKRQEISKDNLEKSTIKKMQTIMIGALASVEQNFGFLWAKDETKILTEEEREIKALFDKVRSEILDKGNGQIRNFKQELELYNIELIKQMVSIPVIPQ